MFKRARVLVPCLFQFDRLFLSTGAEEALSDVSSSGDCKGTGGTETAGGDGTTSRKLWGADPRYPSLGRRSNNALCPTPLLQALGPEAFYVLDQEPG